MSLVALISFISGTWSVDMTPTCRELGPATSLQHRVTTIRTSLVWGHRERKSSTCLVGRSTSRLPRACLVSRTPAEQRHAAADLIPSSLVGGLVVRPLSMKPVPAGQGAISMPVRPTLSLVDSGWIAACFSEWNKWPVINSFRGQIVNEQYETACLTQSFLRDFVSILINSERI